MVNAPWTGASQVSQCWNGGTGQVFGGKCAPSRCGLQGWPHAFPGPRYLNNHNWVEYWDNIQNTWHCPQANHPQRLICIYHPETFVAFTKLRRFLDVATSSSSEDTWFCQPGAVYCNWGEVGQWGGISLKSYCQCHQCQFPGAPPFLKIKQAAASQHTFKQDQGDQGA